MFRDLNVTTVPYSTVYSVFLLASPLLHSISLMRPSPISRVHVCQLSPGVWCAHGGERGGRERTYVTATSLPYAPAYPCRVSVRAAVTGGESNVPTAAAAASRSRHLLHRHRHVSISRWMLCHIGVSPGIYLGVVCPTCVLVMLTGRLCVGRVERQS